ncbi:hypothetical protein ACIBEJ_02560 [Nonomuraea sp. NPDC050790]|uniref:hypothetical protein n=1 Tax=Nonomuraea sp. NPDC050790 TaxID=3364371 RepID=UPI0037875EEA
MALAHGAELNLDNVPLVPIFNSHMAICPNADGYGPTRDAIGTVNTRIRAALASLLAWTLAGVLVGLPLAIGGFWALVGLMRLIDRHPWVSWPVLVAFAAIAIISWVMSMRDAWERRTSRRTERQREVEIFPLEVRSDPGERLRTRIKAVNDAFTEAAILMDELRRDLEAQQTVREALLAEADSQQKLLEIDKEQAEKIRQILVGETKATVRAERRHQWMFFVLGISMSVPIGVFVNWIS